ncbi:CopG family transcriptional regulator [Variovorax terrae]|uniref:CopG family transcriptional regulator n=1 Tax=Variovorax terrae TaxID=2923278 RepID=A0A9X1VY83_9BURK|nr:CopG family transcriptional regulator [Variovorax terrae]MCJ0766091.1 CopG family transcriptional regulator [Variovorax terrae]
MQASATSTRATVYFDGELHQALRLKAATSGLSISDLVNRAVSAALAEDADDVQAHRDRALEPVVDFADLVVSLKASGKI